MKSAYSKYTKEIYLPDFYNHLHQALAQSAGLMWDQAAKTCASEDGDCLAYHRVWQYLRLMGLNTSIESDSGFIIENLCKLQEDGLAGKILLCGTADYGLLAHIDWASRLESSNPVISVMDRCATPLVINNWYAQKYNLTIKTVQRDILTGWPGQNGQFDVICTHNLLGFYDLSDRGRLLDQFFQLLKPGGKLLTVVRLRPAHNPVSGDTCIPTAVDVAGIVDRASRAFAENAINPSISSAEFACYVREFVGKSKGYAIRSEVDFQAELGNHGFTLLVADQHSAPNPIRSYGENGRDSDSSNRLLLRLVASKM